jgi:hypothetical protein
MIYTTLPEVIGGLEVIIRRVDMVKQAFLRIKIRSKRCTGVITNHLIQHI